LLTRCRPLVACGVLCCVQNNNRGGYNVGDRGVDGFDATTAHPFGVMDPSFTYNMANSVVDDTNNNIQYQMVYYEGSELSVEYEETPLGTHKREGRGRTKRTTGGWLTDGVLAMLFRSYAGGPTSMAAAATRRTTRTNSTATSFCRCVGGWNSVLRRAAFGGCCSSSFPFPWLGYCFCSLCSCVFPCV
jgi:hypothetical protein